VNEINVFIKIDSTSKKHTSDNYHIFITLLTPMHFLSYSRISSDRDVHTTAMKKTAASSIITKSEIKWKRWKENNDTDMISFMSSYSDHSNTHK